MKTIFAIYNDGNHVHCCETEDEAINYIEDNIDSANKYLEYGEEEYTPNCDCGLDLEEKAYDRSYDNAEAELKGN